MIMLMMMMMKIMMTSQSSASFTHHRSVTILEGRGIDNLLSSPPVPSD